LANDARRFDGEGALIDRDAKFVESHSTIMGTGQSRWRMAIDATSDGRRKAALIGRRRAGRHRLEIGYLWSPDHD